MIELKSKREIELMKAAGEIVALVHQTLKEVIEPGMSTLEMDRVAEKIIHSNHATPSFKGYNGFPASICASINEEVVHGIPSRKRIVKEGDIVSVDVGAIYQGYHGDGAVTIPVGKILPSTQNLLDVTQKSLMKGIEKALLHNRLTDISHAVQMYAESCGFSVVRDYVGHGIGREMHEAPQIPNFGPSGHGPKLKTGMVLAIEPMVNIGTYEVETLKNGWTVVTKDHSLSAHFEHTVAITENGPEILTTLHSKK